MWCRNKVSEHTNLQQHYWHEFCTFCVAWANDDHIHTWPKISRWQEKSGNPNNKYNSMWFWRLFLNEVHLWSILDFTYPVVILPWGLRLDYHIEKYVCVIFRFEAPTKLVFLTYKVRVMVSIRTGWVNSPGYPTPVVPIWSSVAVWWIK